MKIRKIKRNRIDVTTYFMPPETKKVAVEYLLYDLIGVIGAVGGTMGLFIGFSMFGNYYLCSLLQDFIVKVRNLQCKLYTFSRNGFQWIRIRWNITKTN